MKKDDLFFKMSMDADRGKGGIIGFILFVLASAVMIGNILMK